LEAVGSCTSSLFGEIKILATRRRERVVYRAVVEVRYPTASIRVAGKDSKYTVYVVESGAEKRQCEVASLEFKVERRAAEVVHAILYAENLPFDDLECILKAALKHLHENWKPQRLEIASTALLLNISKGQLAALLREVGGFLDMNARRPSL